jgi:hypothetical protein
MVLVFSSVSCAFHGASIICCALCPLANAVGSPASGSQTDSAINVSLLSQNGSIAHNPSSQSPSDRFGSMPLVANNSPAVGDHYANQKNAHLQQGSNILDLTWFFFCLFFSRFLDLEHCNGVALQNLSSPLRKKSLLTKKTHQIQH